MPIKRAFLRSAGSLIQTIGRASRHLSGMALLYADKETDSMKRAIGETGRRRRLQKKYNDEHGIRPSPETIVKSIRGVIRDAREDDEGSASDRVAEDDLLFGSPQEIRREIERRGRER